MNIKKIKSIGVYKLLLASILVFNSCGEELNEVELIEASHRVVFTSEMDFQNTIEVEGYITFGDVSSGVVSRTWGFPASATMDASPSDAVVKSFFNEVGTHNVTLNQVFKGDAFDIEGTTPIGSVLDTTIVVTVLPPVTSSLTANYINNDGTLGDALVIADNAENEVVSGKSVKFTQNSTGVPITFVWDIEGANTSEGAIPGEIDAKYGIRGVFDLQFIASRTRPFGGDTISIKNLIKVIPSTEPVTLDRTTDKDGNIALEFSREIDAASLNAANFSVTIDNGGTIINPNVASASLDATAGNVVLLTLENESIYNDDIITVSYTPGTLTTADGVTATAFVGDNLIFNNVNLITDSAVNYDYSFEGTTAVNWPWSGWDPPFNGYNLTISDDQAQDGNVSALIEMEPGVGTIFTNRTGTGEFKTIPVETGKDYEIGIWSYVVSDVSGIDPAGEQPAFRFFWFPGVDWGVGDVVTYGVDFETNKWVYGSTFVTFSEAGDIRFEIRGFNASNSNVLQVYIDNISVSEVSLRP